MGIQNEHSFQLPIFYKIAITHKQGGYISAEKNILPAVDVNDSGFSILSIGSLVILNLY